MENMLRDLFLEDFNKYCPYIIGYNHTRDENGFVLGEPMFMGEVVKSFEWNDDEEAKVIPDLYLLETIEPDDEDGEYEYEVVKVERDFYDRFSSPVKITVHEDK